MKMKILTRVNLVPFSFEIFIFFCAIEIPLTSLYVDEQSLTRDQVILPRDFLNFNLQRHIKQSSLLFEIISIGNQCSLILS